MVKLQEPDTGIACGPDKGYKTAKRKSVQKAVLAVKRVGKQEGPMKGITHKAFVKTVIRETVGYAPYERRIMDLLKLGNSKRALKLAKARLGTHKRAKRKKDQMEQLLMN
jgi:large subunit ribosomal protein L36e